MFHVKHILSIYVKLELSVFFNTYVLFTSLAQIIRRYGTFIQTNYCSFQLSSQVIATLKTVQATN
jgi:hypothetical protein